MSKSGSSSLDRLSRLAESASGDDPRAVTFTRGLMLGALVGAAIAGSTIWQRRHARASAVPHGGDAASHRESHGSDDSTQVRPSP